GIRDFHVTGVQTCALPISDPVQRARGPPQNRSSKVRRTLSNHRSMSSNQPKGDGVVLARPVSFAAVVVLFLRSMVIHLQGFSWPNYVYTVLYKICDSRAGHNPSL